MYIMRHEQSDYFIINTRMYVYKRNNLKKIKIDTISRDFFCNSYKYLQLLLATNNTYKIYLNRSGE